MTLRAAARWYAAMSEGRTLSLEDAIAYALQEPRASMEGTASQPRRSAAGVRRGVVRGATARAPCDEVACASGALAVTMTRLKGGYSIAGGCQGVPMIQSGPPALAGPTSRV